VRGGANNSKNDSAEGRVTPQVPSLWRRGPVAARECRYRVSLSSWGRSIQVRRSYFRSLGLLSIPLAGLLAYALGARRDVLFWSTLLGAFPLQFIMGFITLRLFRPDAELTGDYRSILHPVDPKALARPAPATDGRNESDA